MFKIRQLLYIMLVINGLGLITLFTISSTKNSYEERPEIIQNLFAQQALTTYETSQPKVSFTPFVNPRAKVQKFTRKTNPFYLLGAYPEPKIPIPYENAFEDTRYNQAKYGLYNDDDYCDRVDFYNLAHPENIFKKKNFFTDYARNTIPRKKTIPKLGKNLMPQFSKYGSGGNSKRKYHLDIKITSFFLNSDAFHKYHEIGKHFLCATQMFNHIPGHRALIRKDDLVQSVDLYAKKFSDKPHCFNKQMFFPYSYRLYLQEECTSFFDKINSQEFKDSLKSEPIQYMVKVGHGSHSGDGVFILDKNQTQWLNKEYNDGKKCGKVDRPLIAQKYISNPLLLDLDNKFDFRIYMLIASTNPLIVYYHDGVLRASLSTYDKFSKERGTHLTNTHLAESIFKKARQSKVHGMTEKQLRDYHLWSFAQLEDYLLESGKVKDPNWLDNHLRPQFRKAMIHIVKMSSDFFWKQSNVYGLFGLDFMLDTNFNLWFIEGNPNPQLLAPSELFDKLLTKLLLSLFDIEYGLYKSRMERVFQVLSKMKKQQEKKGGIHLQELRAEYQEAIKNRFEPHYRPKEGNSFTLIMDESLPGSEAYFGNMPSECAMH